MANPTPAPTPTSATPVSPKQPSILARGEEYLFSVGAKKAAYAVAKLLTAIVCSAAAQNLMHKFGVTVDPQVFMTSVAAAVMAGLELAQDYFKLKTGSALL